MKALFTIKVKDLVRLKSDQVWKKACIVFRFLVQQIKHKSDDNVTFESVT